MVLKTQKPSRGERTAMTREELLRTVWLLDDITESMRWIPVEERLPEEPVPGTEEDYLPEYIVMITGAERPAVLSYAGGGDWWDGVTKEFYPVTAWMPLPEPYKPAE